jgi:hypothetical protein
MRKLFLALMCLLAINLAYAQINGGGPNGGGGGGGSGTVTSVTAGTGLTGGTITTSGTVALAVPVTTADGGTGTTSTLTGVVRGGSPLTAAELSGDVTTSGSNVTTIAANAVTNAKAAQMAAASIKCNSTGSTANATDCNPLQVANLMGAVLSVDIATTANITLSGTQTIDGDASLVIGQIVLVKNQTTASQNGFYVYSAGAWPRAANFPAGYVIPEFCNLNVFVANGTAFGGSHIRLLTTGGTITIGTTSQTWIQTTFPNATTTVAGLVYATDAVSFNLPVAVYAKQGAPVVTIGDCAGFNTLSGDVGDLGDAAGNDGFCVVSDANGHALLQNASGTGPTANHGTLDTAASDQRGIVTGLSTVTSLTITFNAAWTYAPSCGSVPAPTVSPTVSTTAVTFTIPSTTGTFNYWCF